MVTKLKIEAQFGFCVIGALEVIFRSCHCRLWHKKDYFPNHKVPLTLES